MTQLTLPQRRVLEALQGGSLPPESFTPAECMVVLRLERRGLVRGTMSKRATITDAGRLALSVHDGVTS